ncbi:MAG: ABC transporter substrate-binding protein [Alphaproteobacteria bacterium]|jgi:microcin C transport system substrate-binding protein|nr:ABC transporter substrate-binding protein [Alphaproteobacteria bacterium]MBT5389400.1 ABC transporter substrate-binding protein [Alphaproteobacteria bacterium]
MKKKLILASFILELLTATSSWAKPQHGISMHGDMKYPANFTHFEHVNPEAPKGGELKLAAIGSFDTLTRTIQGVAPEGLLLTRESLLSRSPDEPFSMYGLLAESVEMAPDRSWVEFNLRPEAKWEDGTPVTVEDVLFSWEIQRDKGIPNMRLFYGKVDKAEQTGPRSVKFTFKKVDGNPDPEMPLLMGYMPIQSKKDWEGKEFDKPTLTAPLTSGPYQIAKFEPGRYIVYERLKNYWGKDVPVRKGQYNFDTIRIDYYRDANVALEAFKSGEYDFRSEADLTRWRNAYIGPHFVKKQIAKIDIEHKRPVGLSGFVFNTRKPIFEDKRVREALSLVFDFEWLNKNIFDGGFIRTTSFYENSDLASSNGPSDLELALLNPYKDKVNPAVFGDKYTPPTTDGSGQNRDNVRKALSLLKQAGWVLQKGVLTNVETKKPFDFEILLNSPEHEKLAMAYKRNLDSLGIKTHIRTVDTAQYEKRRLDWDYDMIWNWWGESLSPGNEQGHYWTTRAADESGSRNYPGIREEVVDFLVEKIASAKKRDDLVAATRALDRILLANHYVVPLYHSNIDRVAYWDKFGHPKFDPVVGINPHTWWLEGTKKKK